MTVGVSMPGHVTTLTVTLLAAALLAAPVMAQDTVQVRSASELRDVLANAQTLLAAGNADDAWTLLQPLEAGYAGDAMFDYLLGVAALDSGRHAEAILSLQRAAATAPQFSGARMELARAHFEAGEADEARPLFVALLAENPPPPVRSVIDSYLAAIDRGPATPPADFSPYAEITVGYDDNANGSTSDQQFMGFTLTPENVATDTSFFDAGAGFNWLGPRSAAFAWQAGVHAGYRQNPDASFVDAGILSGLGGFRWKRGANFGQFGIDAYAASRDGNSNESYGGANLRIGHSFSDVWDLSLTLRGGALRFDEAIETLDVDRLLYSVSLGWRVSPRGRLAVEALGGSDSEKQAGSPYGNSKAGARLSINAALGERAFLFASVGTLTSDYDGLFFGSRREDTQLSSIVQVEFRDVLTEGLSLLPRIRYVDNDSDVALYDWDRTEVGLQLRWEPR